MGQRARPRAPLVVSDHEREVLESDARTRKGAHPLASRARAILLAAQGKPDTEASSRSTAQPMEMQLPEQDSSQRPARA